VAKRPADHAAALPRRGDRIVLGVMVVLAAIGLALATYLTTIHYDGQPLACTVGTYVNCNAVTHSPESLVWGTQIPVTVPGAVWFLVSGGLAAWALLGREQRWLAWAQLLWSVLALLFVFYLVYSEVAVIHQLCEWCTAVHLLVLATLLLSVRRLQTREEG
jgi:uncharacterized membrane protein